MFGFLESMRRAIYASNYLEGAYTQKDFEQRVAKLKEQGYL